MGFNNVANFNRRFLEIKGATPSEFRRQAERRFGMTDGQVSGNCTQMRHSPTSGPSHAIAYNRCVSKRLKTEEFMQQKDHWEHIYSTKPTTGVSWFQEHALQSLKLIESSAAPASGAIIDVGGGASTLVDDLLAKGYSDLTVLDLSSAALGAARNRLGPEATRVHWLEGDVTSIALPVSHYDVWHDRAVFHFLTSDEQRQAYVQAVLHAVMIVSTFAEDGPYSAVDYQ